MKCLIIEDNEFLREGLMMFLQGVADIETAGNGREGVDLFSAALRQGPPFDLVLLDIVMPEMDGQQALRLMRKAEKEEGTAGRKSVIIMTTSLNSPANMEEAMWDGDCTDYLVKPVSRADLMAVLQRHGLL
ncbi:response regulator [Geomonas subterranea]|uniref:Response regulator n=1 Tax=Geomonas subterranea TaxID=2847989 RepID=A0ABX8LDC5_9BACT|nr:MULTISPECIES: response regulator [Geomonas]QXE89657.1 response regulator [Geomonas subterranea]QXM08228.1 response regulator [Geomonas subterranea]